MTNNFIFPVALRFCKSQKQVAMAVGDRAFAPRALCLRQCIHGLFRASQRPILDFRPRRPHLPPGTSPKNQAGKPPSRWLQEARPGEDLPDLVVNPDRLGRVQPRVRKRRPKQYPLMKRPRAELRKALLKQRPAA
jgi:hypothetical protein